MRYLIAILSFGCLVPGLAAENVMIGKELFETRCNVCHKLPDTARRSPAQWALLVEVMQQTMANKGIAQLTQAEQQALLVYLANDRSEAAAEVAANPGRDTYVARCALCHQLPEPGMLRPRQWQAILLTMQQRMQQAGMPELTTEERDLILGYLSRPAEQ